MWGKFEVIPGDILPLASECRNKVGRFLVKKCSFVLFLVVGIVVVVVVVQKRTSKKDVVSVVTVHVVNVVADSILL